MVPAGACGRTVRFLEPFLTESLSRLMLVIFTPPCPPLRAIIVMSSFAVYTTYHAAVHFRPFIVARHFATSH